MMKNKEEYLSTSVPHTKMTNRSKTDVWIVNSLTGGEKLLVDNSFHFYIMLPPLQTYSCLDPTQQRNLLLQTRSHLVGHKRVSIEQLSRSDQVKDCTKNQPSKQTSVKEQNKEGEHYGLMDSWGPDNICVPVTFVDKPTSICRLHTHTTFSIYHKVINHSHKGIFLSSIKGIRLSKSWGECACLKYALVQLVSVGYFQICFMIDIYHPFRFI